MKTRILLCSLLILAACSKDDGDGKGPKKDNPPPPSKPTCCESPLTVVVQGQYRWSPLSAFVQKDAERDQWLVDLSTAEVSPEEGCSSPLVPGDQHVRWLMPAGLRQWNFDNEHILVIYDSRVPTYPNFVLTRGNARLTPANDGRTMRIGVDADFDNQTWASGSFDAVICPEK